jgi:hypothetical protein
MSKPKNDAYAICTAQKKKGGMDHDSWKRCVQHVQKEDTMNNFSERVRVLLEKKKKKVKEMDLDDIERYQDETEKDEADAKTRASARSGQAVEMKEDEKEFGAGVDDNDDTPEQAKRKRQDQILLDIAKKKDEKARKRAALSKAWSQKEEKVNEAADPECLKKAQAARAAATDPTRAISAGDAAYRDCMKAKGDDNRDDDNPSNQRAKQVMQRGSSFTKQGKFGEGKDWINKAADSIEDRGTEGKCTPITKKGCTGRAKALAKTFKKIAKKRDAKIVSKKEKAAKKKN